MTKENLSELRDIIDDSTESVTIGYFVSGNPPVYTCPRCNKVIPENELDDHLREDGLE